MLEVRFRTKKLRARCCDFSSSTEYWGKERAELIALRLQQLASMASIDDVSFLPCEAKFDGERTLHVAVDGGCFLIITAVADMAEDPQFGGDVLVVEEIAEIENHE